MSTPQENRQRFQEIANRGLADRLDPDKKARFDEAVRRGLISVPEPVEPIERTVTGRVGEFFRGLPRGAVGLLETAATGASALLPEELETSARERIASIGEAAAAPFQPKPGYEDSISAKFGEAAGSTLPFFAAGPFGLAGRVAATGLGAGAGAGTARERAEQLQQTSSLLTMGKAQDMRPNLLALQVEPLGLQVAMQKLAKLVISGLFLSLLLLVAI